MANNYDSDLIEEALVKVLQNHDDADEGDILVEWVLIAFVTNPDEEKGHGYPMLYSNGNIPTYRARGLLETGLLSLRVPE